MNFAEIEAALIGLDKFDARGALAAVRAGNLSGELVAGEQILDVLSAFWPEAKYAEDALKLLGFIVAAKQAGLWAPAQPEDPAMQRASGPAHGGH